MATAKIWTMLYNSYTEIWYECVDSNIWFRMGSSGGSIGQVNELSGSITVRNVLTV
jgi:hypothetical protein